MPPSGHREDLNYLKLPNNKSSLYTNPKMEDNSGELSDGLDEFEESIDETKQRGNFTANRNQTTYSDKPYDEAYEVSQDLSMAESFDGREKYEKERKLKNDKYDEAVEVSQSLDQRGSTNLSRAKPAAEEKEISKGMKKGTEQTKSQSVMNKHFDEALEFSHSGSSDDSVDTKSAEKSKKGNEKIIESKQGNQITSTVQKNAGVQNSLVHLDAAATNKKGASVPATGQKTATQQQSAAANAVAKKKDGGEESSSDEEGDHEESYENIEGAYNPKDFLQLNVTAEVRDLFQYIERYKPQEVELETPLKCFIPEYIPAIGELDAFIKVPRPDGKEDGLGLRYLDEPSTNQSDPTVLELQLRAKSKKLQNGDVVVRSIENADRNPAKIEKWIQDIADLHRSKPPPQVHYKKNMPDIETLMDVWPEEMEALLESLTLPPPEMDLSLAEYVRVLCSILDIPVYDNPIESLHVMFTLFLDFRSNPHFQARMAKNGGGLDSDEKDSDGRTGKNSNFGGADVLQIDQD